MIGSSRSSGSSGPRGARRSSPSSRFARWPARIPPRIATTIARSSTTTSWPRGCSNARDRICRPSSSPTARAGKLAGLNARFRACRYRGGQAFCIHRDGAHVPSDELRSHRTLQIYLDADPELVGGRTRFYRDASGTELVAAVAPRAGTAIVFDHRAWHDGEPVTRGTKHVLRTDVMYRRAGSTRTDEPGVIGRHRGYAWRVIACRDGSLASAGRDGCIRRWSAHGATCTALERGSIMSLVEAADGTLWSGTREGCVIAGEREIARDLGAVLALERDASRAGIVAATAHGELIAFALDGTRRWTTRVHDGWAWALAPHSGGLASVGDDGRLAHTDALGHTQTLRAVGAPCRALAALADGTLVAGDRDGFLHGFASERAHSAAITACARSGTAWSRPVKTAARGAGQAAPWSPPARTTSPASPSRPAAPSLPRATMVRCADYGRVR